MARRFVELVFDDAVVGTSPVFTADHFELLLGSCSRVALQALVDGVTGTLPTLSVLAEHTLDGRSWRSVSPGGTPEINRETLDPIRTNNASGVAAYTSPRFPRMRFRVTLGGTNPSARVKLYATGRDKP
ncbi:MAG: hypothetical protein JNL21_22510 [Myxococcales bacterium]|nr:hypothetical protein [Myxococcales bacterium]